MTTAAERKARIERAHYNVLALDAADVAIDLYTDVPRLAVLPAVRDAETDISLGGMYAPALDEAAAAIYGPARYVWAVRGRAAELAMAASLIDKGDIVIGNGLFRTTQVAFRRAGADVELEPGSPSRVGSGDIDLKWLELRLAEGEVSWVCIETANNALAGWPVSFENLQAVRALCDRHRAGLLMDATRLLSGCLLTAPDRDPFEVAKAMTGLTDAFWVSCAKELIAPVGAFLAVRNIEAQRKAFHYTFDEGTWLDGVEARTRSLRGMQAIRADISPLRQRQAQIALVADVLRKQGVRILEPAGAHAVFVPIDAELLQGSPSRARSLECLLYLRAGVRVLIQPYPRMGYTALIRIAIAVGRYTDAELVAAAQAIVALIREPSEAPELVEQPGVTEGLMHEMVKGYVVRG